MAFKAGVVVGARAVAVGKVAADKAAVVDKVAVVRVAVVARVVLAGGLRPRAIHRVETVRMRRNQR